MNMRHVGQIVRGGQQCDLFALWLSTGPAGELAAAAAGSGAELPDDAEAPAGIACYEICA